MTPTFAEATRVWARIGCLSFGGPAAQIAMLHLEAVERRRWVTERRFLEALSVCTLLPGPEAQQLAIYLGWLLHGVRGGLSAGLLFVLPGALVMMALSVLYVSFGAVPAVAALFFGLKCAVLVLVADALRRVAKRALTTRAAYAIAASSFVALFAFGVPFPVVVFAAGLLGLLMRPSGESVPAVLEANRSSRPARIAGLVAVVAWVAPPAALVLAHGGVLADVGVFFAKLAVVTFGGAYAVLAYAAQDAVRVHHWLTPGQMLDGLGLAETTPGPLILVLQFVGFLAGYGAGGIGLGVVAALLTLWVTFAPGFAMVFLVAPSVERVLRVRALASALAAITAAVVGVIANLAVWFGLHLLFPASLDVAALVLVVAAGVALLRLRVGVLSVLLGCAVAGLGLHLIKVK